MKFLFVANTPRDTNLGAPNIDIATMNALRQLGHDVDEIWGTDMPRRITHPNLHQLLELPHSYALAVNRCCMNQEYDVIQVNQPHAYLAAKAHQLLCRPGVFINRSHGWEPAVREALEQYRGTLADRRAWWRRRASRVMSYLLERHNGDAVRWSDGIILSSVDDEQFVVNHYEVRAEKLMTLAPGISPEFFSELPTEAPRRWSRLLHVGNFSPQKAPEIVAAVFRRVIEAHPECKATWVCPARCHLEARRLIGKPAVDSVVFLDWMPRSELLQCYDNHGILIFPSYFEGFAQTFLEGMSRGQCVLTTAVDGMRQTIRDGVDGFTFPSGSSEAIAKKAIQLICNPDECRQVSVRARETALQFTWERTARNFVDFCTELLSLRKTRMAHLDGSRQR